MTALRRRLELEAGTPAPMAQRRQLSVISAPAPPPATSIHLLAAAIPAAAHLWFTIVTWSAFGNRETALVLAVITFFFLIFFRLLIGGAAMARSRAPAREQKRSFRDFLNGDVEIATGYISGREALWQIAAMPAVLCLGSAAIALIAATA